MSLQENGGQPAGVNESGEKSARRTRTEKVRRDAAFEVGRVIDVPLHEAMRTRFLNYAVSVITDRALPDVRDGLKPVQRRILYAMYHDLHLLPEKSTLKCAKVVGQVLGNYHPHGDSSVYEAMVRMAQDWTLRYPLVFGQGNFGSIDGDGAAAYRYTEAKLRPLAMEFVRELGLETVDFRPNFDDSEQEPSVLPARVPQLVINGCMGIAVGIATNIPPHNISEVLEACVALSEHPDMTCEDLTRYIKGPDFPTGGEICESAKSLSRIYSEGKGSVRVRGTYAIEDVPRQGPRIVINSVPYMVNKAKLTEQIGNLVLSNKIPQIQDVRDESTADIRVVIETAKGTDVLSVMAKLYKCTDLESMFHVNMTCLTPRGPERVDLRTILQDFLDFRYEVTVRRLNHEVRLLNERIHILEGFVKIFDALDEAIAIIRNSEGRQDAADKLMLRFDLDQIQADAILDLRLYKLARTDILQIRQELEDKVAQRDKLLKILGDDNALWKLIRGELNQCRKLYGDERRTVLTEGGVPELQYDDADFIVAEDAQVVLTQDGWVRRVTMGTDLSKLRLRQDDEVHSVLTGSTLDSAIFFTNLGAAYTMRINDLPNARAGFGEPVQKFFNFSDGERVVALFVVNPRSLEAYAAPEQEGALPPVQLLALASDGKGLRFSLSAFAEPSTKNGRRYARVGEDSRIMAVEMVRGSEQLILLSQQARMIIFSAAEISFLQGAGRGVALIKLEAGDKLKDYMLVRDQDAGFVLQREENGNKLLITPRKLKPVARGGKGTQVIRRGRWHVEAKVYGETAQDMTAGKTDQKEGAGTDGLLVREEGAADAE